MPPCGAGPTAAAPHWHPCAQANGLERVATAVALEWGSPLGSDAPPELRPPFDLVLASDVLYLAEALPLFVSTLRQLSGPETLTLLCNERRPALPFPWALFRRAGFEVRQVPLGEQHPDWRSEDIELFRIQLSSSGGDSSSGGTDQEAA